MLPNGGFHCSMEDTNLSHSSTLASSVPCPLLNFKLFSPMPVGKLIGNPHFLGGFVLRIYCIYLSILDFYKLALPQLVIGLELKSLNLPGENYLKTKVSFFNPEKPLISILILKCRYIYINKRLSD